VEDLAAGRIIEKIEKWVEIKESLKDYFSPRIQAWIARNRLLTLKHVGKIQAYIKEFTGLILDIKDMSK